MGNVLQAVRKRETKFVGRSSTKPKKPRWIHTPMAILALAFSFLSEKEFCTSARLVCSHWHNIRPDWTILRLHKTPSKRLVGAFKSVTSLVVFDIPQAPYDSDLKLLTSVKQLYFAAECDFESAQFLNFLFEAGCLSNVRSLHITLPCLTMERIRSKDSAIQRVGWAVAELRHSLTELSCSQVGTEDFAALVPILTEFANLVSLRISGVFWISPNVEDLRAFLPIALGLEVLDFPWVYWRDGLLSELRLPNCKHAYLQLNQASPLSIITFLEQNCHVSSFVLHNFSLKREYVETLRTATKSYQGKLNLIVHTFEADQLQLFEALAQIRQVETLELTGCDSTNMRELAQGLTSLKKEVTGRSPPNVFVKIASTRQTMNFLSSDKDGNKDTSNFDLFLAKLETMNNQQ
jgi:hypothetical protein